MKRLWQNIKETLKEQQTHEAVLTHLQKHYESLRENHFLLQATARCITEINQQISQWFPREHEDEHGLAFEARLMNHPITILAAGSYYLHHRCDFHSSPEEGDLEVVRFVVHLPPEWRLFPSPIAYHEVSRSGKNEGTYFSGNFKAPLRSPRGILQRMAKKKYRLPDATYHVVPLPTPSPHPLGSP